MPIPPNWEPNTRTVSMGNSRLSNSFPSEHPLGARMSSQFRVGGSQYRVGGSKPVQTIRLLMGRSPEPSSALGAAFDLNDQIAIWVNEGGAGGEVDR
jgi:hypothetical protein